MLGALFARWADETIDADELCAGDRLGAYELIALAGEGGMGQVYRARRAEVPYEQIVALKLLVLEAADAVAFAREARSLARLSHPHIARLIDAGEDQGRWYIATEWIAGLDLEQWLKTGPSLAERLLCLRQIASAVAHAHAQLIVHCDLKPANIRIDQNQAAKVLDFGIAGILDDPEHGQARGLTPGHASPEQLRGEAPSVAIDIWLYGKLADRVLPPALLSDRLRRREWQAVIARCTADERDQRYASASELETELKRFTERQPVQAIGDGAGYRWRCLWRRHWQRIAGLLLLLALITALTGWYLQQVQAARADAEAAAERASALLEFLIDTLAGADPRAQGGKQPTLEQVLERAAVEAPTRFTAQPDRAVAILDAIGQIYLAREQNAAALPVLENARTLADAQTESIAAQAERWRLIGSAQLQGKAIEEAIAAYDRAAELAARSADQRLQLRIAMGRALALNRRGELAQALQQVGEALERYAPVYGADDPDLAVYRTNYAQLLAVSRQFPQAAAQLELAHTALSQTKGASHPDTLNALGALAQIRSILGDHAAAARALADVAEGTRIGFGERSRPYLLAQNALALAAFRQNDHDRAADVLGAALTVAREALPGDSATLTLIESLGDVRYAQQRYADAEALYSEMLTSGVAGLDSEVGQRPAKLARTLIALGRCDQAQPLLAQAEQLAKERAPAAHPVHQVLAAQRKRCPIE